MPPMPAGGVQQVLQLQRHNGPLLYRHRPASVSAAVPSTHGRVGQSGGRAPRADALCCRNTTISLLTTDDAMVSIDATMPANSER